MKFINKATYKVLLIEAAVFLCSVIGVIFIISDLKSIFNDYTRLSEECIYEQNLMQDIENYVRQEQFFTSMYIMTDEPGAMTIYGQQKELNRSVLKLYLADFSNILEEKNQHVNSFQLKSICKLLFEKSDYAIGLKNSSGKIAAMDFYVKSQSDYNSILDAHIQKLSEYVDNEVKNTEKIIKIRKDRLRNLILAIFVFLLISFFVSLYVVYKLSRAVENRTDNLEKEVEETKNMVSEQHLKLIDFQKDTIYGMANLIEIRNGETGEHVKRTSLYVDLIAKNLKKRGIYTDILTDHYIELLEKAAPMHDVGKIMIPDNILTKPGKLTVEEFEIMKKHASEGGRIVREVMGKMEDEDYVEMASSVAMHHHEKWNGNGYPANLKEEEIPLCARIMAIADVFDALVSVRCYKKAISPEEAFEIIRDSSGSHFDPVIVELFLEIKDEILKIFNETD